MPGPFKRGLIIDELKWLQKTLEFPKQKRPALRDISFSLVGVTGLTSLIRSGGGIQEKQISLRLVFVSASFLQKQGFDGASRNKNVPLRETFLFVWSG